jgi:hypothetical protein
VWRRPRKRREYFGELAQGSMATVRERRQGQTGEGDLDSLHDVLDAG